MKVLLGFIAIVFLAHHFLKEDSIGSVADSYADMDFPHYFTPKKWDAQERSSRLGAFRAIVTDMDKAIANPPTIM